MRAGFDVDTSAEEENPLGPPETLRLSVAGLLREELEKDLERAAWLLLSLHAGWFFSSSRAPVLKCEGEMVVLAVVRGGGGGCGGLLLLMTLSFFLWWRVRGGKGEEVT